jgi:hypothetical protein
MGRRVPGEVQVMTQPIGLSTDQKLTFCKRALKEMNAAQGTMDKPSFSYHFGAFLALLGGVRQYLLSGASKQDKDWVYAFDDPAASGLDYALAVDLRNVDVHFADATAPRSHYTVGMTENLSLDRTLSTQPTDNTTSVVYYITLPSDPLFLVHRGGPQKGEPRSNRPLALAHLQSTAAIDLARSALAFFETSILPNAKITIP